MKLSFTINGAPITKKNSQQILTNRATGRPFIMPSKQYKAYEKDAIVQLRSVKAVQPEPIAEPVNLQCVYYMPTRRKTDLCNLLEATCDVLVRAGVLVDDNSSIVVGHDGSRVLYDKESPRVEVCITYIEWGGKQK